MNQLLEDIENIKEKVTSQEYMDLMNHLGEVNDLKNKPLYKLKLLNTCPYVDDEIMRTALKYDEIVIPMDYNRYEEIQHMLDQDKIYYLKRILDYAYGDLDIVSECYVVDIKRLDDNVPITVNIVSEARSQPSGIISLPLISGNESITEAPED